MKKAKKFSDWCYKTLSEEEVKMLFTAIDTICSNHENEPWSKVYLAINVKNCLKKSTNELKN